jgi:hypothetical protein
MASRENAARPVPRKQAGTKPPGWLRGETLQSLATLNEECLRLLREEALCGSCEEPLVRELEPLWSVLEGAARVRAAGCPYLLLDGGFADARRWSGALRHQIHDAERGEVKPFFTVPGALEAGRLVFTFAWHLAHSEPAAARLLLGMSPACAELLAATTLPEVYALAERRSAWLQPRWPGRLVAWRALLEAAIHGDGEGLEQARLRGVRLLAAEVRQAPGQEAGSQGAVRP